MVVDVIEIPVCVLAELVGRREIGIAAGCVFGRKRATGNRGVFRSAIRDVHDREDSTCFFEDTLHAVERC
ncbi:MAG: hypothetical protein CMK36_08035 [Porticoccaceae bacterium]|nr:hypothetical protein [Porticoccaceae bacterium]